MSIEQRPPDSFPRGPTFMGGLQALLSSLMGLYSQISSQLLSDRMSTQHRSKSPREALPIGNLLDHHIEQSGAASRETAGALPRGEAPEFIQVGEERSTSAVGNTSQAHSGAGLFDALSSYFGRHRSSAHSGSLLHEKMRANTLEHINKARVLARRGDVKGAKVHAALAETAMQTAGEYMSDGEYRRFREQVETRLGTLRKSAG